MDKLIQFSTKGGLGECFAEALDITPRGAGLTKIAGSLHPRIAEFLRGLRPDPKYQFVLMTPMGAFEYWGMNVNGDIFPEVALSFDYTAGDPLAVAKALEEKWLAPFGLKMPSGNYREFGYRTFEDALRYRHHCFVAGTPVVMADRTRKAIEDVRVGDVVATRQGPHHVLRTFRRRYTGEGVRLCLRGTEDIVSTDEHPYFVVRRDSVHCSHRYNRWAETYTDHLVSHPSCGVPRLDVDEMPAKDILPGDYVLVPVPSHGDERVDREFAELVGWVASEGYLGAHGVIQFSFSDKNVDDVSAVMACLQENGLHVTMTPRYQYGLVMLTSCNKKLHERLSHYVRGVLGEKHLTGDVLSWNRESLLRLLGAYIDGDGHVSARGKNEGQLRIRSSSDQMLLTLADIIRSLGADCTINHDNPVGEMLSPTNGQVYASSGSGCVAVARGYSSSLCEYSRKIHIAVVRKNRNVQEVGDCRLTRVLDVVEVDIDEDVLNLEVEGVNEYIAGEVAVHNCNKNSEVAYGDIPLSVWNSDMKRVEVIVRHDREKAKLVGAEDIILDIDEGRPRQISMGCKTPFDICTKCGHISRTTEDYCEHLHFGMGSINQDGSINGAVNPFPRFFDLSDVFIPAAKESGVLRKVAHVTRTEPTKKADVQKDVLSNVGSAAVKKVSAGEPDLPQEALRGQDFFRLLSTLALLGVVLKPQEFQYGALHGAGHGDLADQFSARREVFAPCPADMSMSLGGFDENIARTFAPFLPERSGFYPHLPRRVFQIIIVQGRGISPETQVSHPVLDKVASAYSAYRQALRDIHTPLSSAILANQEFYRSNFLGDLLVDSMEKTASVHAGTLSTPLVAEYLYRAYRDGVSSLPTSWKTSPSPTSPARALFGPVL